MIKKNNKIIEDKIISILKTIYDPEVSVNIYELGLIYDVKIYDNNNVVILMTLTSPNCPVAESLPKDVLHKTKLIEGVNEVEVKLTFTPPWNSDMMSEEAKLELGVI